MVLTMRRVLMIRIVTRNKFDIFFSCVVSLTGVATTVTFLVASVVRGFDPVSAIAAFVVLAATKYVVRD